MKERPILFSAPMVRAILEGRKTMTRRVIKPQPKLIESSGRWYWEKALDVHGHPLVDASRYWWEYYGTSPHGQPGDRLWVREAFQTLEDFAVKDAVYYRADGETVTALVEGEEIDLSKSWRPSIFMPRWASRIILEVTAVRVERLKDISLSDIEAEGIPDDRATGNAFLQLGKFRDLWDSINAKRGYGWDANPWVWVISFKRIKP